MSFSFDYDLKVSSYFSLQIFFLCRFVLLDPHRFIKCWCYYCYCYFIVYFLLALKRKSMNEKENLNKTNVGADVVYLNFYLYNRFSPSWLDRKTILIFSVFTDIMLRGEGDERTTFSENNTEVFFWISRSSKSYSEFFFHEQTLQLHEEFYICM